MSQTGASAAETVSALKAAGDPSRLRILAILASHELTVSELVEILGQSQPRISRHLRVLVEAGLLHRKAEGTSAYYRVDRGSVHQSLVCALLEGLDHTDPELARDADRLQVIRDARAERAAKYFEAVAVSWDRMRGRHVPEAEIEAALVETIAPRAVGTFVDLGTGTGRILEVVAPFIRNGVGIDLSRDMLAVARDKLERLQLQHCDVRQGNIHNLDLPAGVADAVVLHHVLHFLDDPGHAVAEAARILRPDAVLAIVDFAPHRVEALRDDYQHQRLGFSDDEIRQWCLEAGLVNVRARTFTPDHADQEALPVTLWTALQRPGAPTTVTLEVA